MKKFVLFLAMIILALSGALNAQGTWTLQTNPTTASGESMQFVSITEGWIGMDSNQLLHTTNSGDVWNVVTPSTTDVTWGMNAPGSRISFISPSTGWVVKTLGPNNDTANGAVLYKTTNGGSIWTRILLSTVAGVGAVQVQFVDANNGWILLFNMNTGEPVFLKTTDGGATWLPTNGAGIFYYLNPTVGYAFSAGPDAPPPYTISKTIDGGTTWTAQYTDNTLGELQAIQFTDLNHGWIVGSRGKILKTVNGGTTWTPVTHPGITSNYENLTVNFLDSNTGFISSRDNTLWTNQYFMLHTTDGGNSWTQQILPFTARIYSAYFWDANHGWAASDSGTMSTGQIARYVNALGVGDVQNGLKDLVVYPNPNSGTFKFKSDRLKFPVSIEIYDTAGKKVFEKNAVNAAQYQVEFKPQNTGLYFLKVSDGNNTFSEKLIVK